MATPVATMDDPLTLRAGDAMCSISPACGGSLTGWTIGRQRLLRAASAADIAARTPLGMASFPLVPYSNRIADGRFDWAGGTVQLARNFAPEPHAIHGVGWQRAWQVTEQGAAAATLSLAHAGDSGWPWPFHAVQQVVLSPDSLTLSLRVTNLHTAPVPLAFGHHPYFDQAGASLQFAAKAVWMNDNAGLPDSPVAPAGSYAFGTEARIEGRALDHCYTGWDGRARIGWEGGARRVEITTSPPLPAAIVYVPHGGDTFCFEPVPHMNNALNLDGTEAAMPVIAPGARYCVDIVFRAVA